jgi:hypothetical protein
MDDSYIKTAALVVSILALGVSLATLYRTQFRRFRLEVRTTGRASISKNPFSINLAEGAVSVELILANLGMLSGVVENLGLVIVDPKGQRFKFRAHLIIKDRKLQLGKELAPPEWETFAAFRLGKEETVTRNVFFAPTPSAANFAFSEGVHRLEIWVWESRTKHWRQPVKLSVSIDSDALSVLASIVQTKQPDGRTFINWKTHDIPSVESEKRIEELTS